MQDCAPPPDGRHMSRRPGFDPEDVRRASELASLSLGPGELERFALELAPLLERFAGIEPKEPASTGRASADGPDELVARGRESRLRFRPDRPDPDLLRRSPSEGAPAWRASHFVVPRLPAHDR